MAIFASYLPMNMRCHFLIMIGLSTLLISGCAGSRSVSPGKSAVVDYNSYNEDLSSVRPVYKSTSIKPPVASKTAVPVTTPRKPDAGKPTALTEAMHVNRRLDLVLDTLATQNRSIRYAPGFRIQVYVGTQRQQVDDARTLITQNFPDLNPYLSYNQPTYKLKVGDFMRRIDAERYYTSIKQLIPSAQLQPDKVDIRRSLTIK